MGKSTINFPHIYFPHLINGTFFAMGVYPIIDELGLGFILIQLRLNLGKIKYFSRIWIRNRTWIKNKIWIKSDDFSFHPNFTKILTNFYHDFIWMKFGGI